MQPLEALECGASYAYDRYLKSAASKRTGLSVSSHKKQQDNSCKSQTGPENFRHTHALF